MQKQGVQVGTKAYSKGSVRDIGTSPQTMSSASQDAESANSNSKGSHDSSTSLFSLPLGYAMNALEHHPTATLLGTAAVTTGAGYLFLNSDFYQRNKRWIWGASAVGAAVTGYYTTKKYMPLVQEVWSSGKALMQMAMGRTTDDENKRSVDIAYVLSLDVFSPLFLRIVLQFLLVVRSYTCLDIPF